MSQTVTIATSTLLPIASFHLFGGGQSFTAAQPVTLPVLPGPYAPTPQGSLMLAGAALRGQEISRTYAGVQVPEANTALLVLASLFGLAALAAARHLRG